MDTGRYNNHDVHSCAIMLHASSQFASTLNPEVMQQAILCAHCVVELLIGWAAITIMYIIYEVNKSSSDSVTY